MHTQFANYIILSLMLRNITSKSSFLAFGLRRIGFRNFAATARFYNSNNSENKQGYDWIITASAVALATVGSAVLCDNSESLREVDIGSVTNFPSGKSTAVKISEEFTVLVTNINGNFHVTGSSCPHYSAPLSKGVTTPTHVTCPWHDAEFDLKTGECINGPSMDPIPVYGFSISKEGHLIAKLPSHDGVYSRKLSRRDPENKSTYVICGGGPAALCAAETLRYEGFTGRVVMLGKETHLPYDRPVLSKNANPDLTEMTLRTLDQLSNIDIEFVGGALVNSVDPEKKKINYTHNAESLEIDFDKVLIATGTQPRKVFAPGNDAPNVISCRTPEDVDQMKLILKDRVPDQSYVVVIGTSFIGLELAASLKRQGYNVVVVGREKVSFDRVLGSKVGGAIQKFFEDKGIAFVNGASVQQFRKDKDSGMATIVDLDNYIALPCDLVVCGAGVQPTVQNFLREPCKLAVDGSVCVDALMKSRQCPDVFAAGDACTFPSVYHDGEDVRIEHWAVAMEQGRVAARNMCGKYSVYQKVPFFWTSWFGKMLRFAGNNRGFDDVVIEGNLKTLQFCAVYLKGDKVCAVATIGRDPVAVAFAELMALGKLPSAEEVKNESFKPEDFVKKLEEYTSNYKKI